MPLNTHKYHFSLQSGSYFQCATRWMCLTSLFVCTSCQKEPSKPPPRPLVIRLVHGPEIKPIVSTLQESFFNQKVLRANGAQIIIEPISEQNVRAAKRLASGDLKTEVWISSSASLVNYTNEHLRNLGAKQVNCKDLFATPTVLAVRADQTSGVETDPRQFNLQKLVLQSDDETNLSIAHGLPNTSTSGLAALIQLTQLSATIRPQEQDPSSATATEVVTHLREIESHISYYASGESALLNRLISSSATRPRAVLTTEQQLATYNSTASSSRGKLVALYPSSPTSWESYQLCTSAADWISSEQKQGIDELIKLAASPAIQSEVKRRGFRPVLSTLPDEAMLSPQNGLTLTLPHETMSPLDGKSMEQLIDHWSEIARPSALVVVLDTSGSMDGAPLAAAKDALRQILAASDSKSLAGLISFSAEPKVESEVRPNPPSLISLIDPLQAQGGSALYDALKRGIEISLSEKIKSYRHHVLLITDGEDKNSDASKESFISYLTKTIPNSDIEISIVAIAHDNINFSDLQQFAQITGGSYREISPSEVAAVVKEVSEKL